MAPLPLEDVRLPRGARRDAALPIFKRVSRGFVHPLRTPCPSGFGETYVYDFERNKTKAKSRHAKSQEYRFSEPFSNGLLKSGFICLCPGDAVFARPPGGSEDGTDDILQVLVLQDSHLPEERYGDDIRQARAEVLGKMEEMGPDVPENGKGGTAFERSGYAKPVEAGARAYPILTTVQAGAGNTVGPGQFMKVAPEDRNSDGVKIRLNALKAVVQASVAAARYLPRQYQEAYERQAELVNAPRFITDDNCFFSSVQLNLARPVSYDNTESTLKDLGSFGKPHVDDRDLSEGFSVMTVCSSFPDDIDPGQFLIHELGVFVNLDGTLFVVFRGVQFHGGSAPRARRPGVVIPVNAYRVVFVSYPKAVVYLALGVYVLCASRTAPNKGDGDASSSKRYLSIGPDILNNPEDKSQPAWITHPNFARDAWPVMTALALITFFVRSLYLLVVFAVRQLPDKYQVRIDSTVFFSAFSYLDDGERVSLGPWELAPHVNDPSANSQRRSAAKSWNEFSAKANAVIPFALIRQDNRAERVEKGETPAQGFHVSSTEPSGRVDGAERPANSNFSLVRSFDGPSAMKPKGKATGRAVSYKQTGGKNTTVANKDVGVKTRSRAKRQLTSQSSEATSSSSSDGDDERAESASAWIPSSPTKTRKQSNTACGGPSIASSPSSEYSRPRRKKAKLGQDDTSHGVTAEAHPQGTSSLELQQTKLSSSYLSWITDATSTCLLDNNRSSSGLTKRFIGSFSPPLHLTEFSFDTTTLLHPWWNPLNGPTLSWTENTPPHLNVHDLPETSRNMFSFVSLDDDFFSVFKETSATPAHSLRTPDQLRVAMSSVTSPLLSASLDGVLRKISSAWAELDVLRKRLSSSSISIRAPAVALMANEAILWATLESFAAVFSQTPLPGAYKTLGLGVVSGHLWDMVHAHETTLEVDLGASVSSTAASTTTLRIPASHRMARTVFERQRVVYAGLLTFLTEQIGIQDHRVPRISAWFVWAIVEELGFDALYHIEVWRAWQYPEARCMTSRLGTKEPSLDVLLPLVGNMSLAAGLAARPMSILARYSMNACTAAEGLNAEDAKRLFLHSADGAFKWERPLMPVYQPPGCANVYRALRVASELIDIPCNDNAKSDVRTIDSFTLHGRRVPLLPPDMAYLLAASQNHDIFLPFAELTPSSIRLRSLFDGQPSGCMTTNLGFRNMVATRLISYNSPFLLSGSQTFVHSVEDLITLFATREESYFISSQMHSKNGYRRTANIRPVWDSCKFPHNAGRSFRNFWNALRHGSENKVQGVGPVLALEIAGDYFASGHLNEPTVMEMGSIIRTINGGGVRGLRAMGFIPDTVSVPQGERMYDLDVVQEAFTAYCVWITSITNEGEREQWRWSLITAESHLRQHDRLLHLINALTPP